MKMFKYKYFAVVGQDSEGRSVPWLRALIRKGSKRTFFSLLSMTLPLFFGRALRMNMLSMSDSDQQLIGAISSKGLI